MHDTLRKKKTSILAAGLLLDSANRVATILMQQPLSEALHSQTTITSYRVVLQREFEKGMMYASYATGFRSGGFFNRGSTAFRAGCLSHRKKLQVLKSVCAATQRITRSSTSLTSTLTTLTSRPRLCTGGNDPVCGKGTAENPAAQGVTCSFTRNAGEVSMDGIEIEAALMPTDALTLRAAIGTF